MSTALFVLLLDLAGTAAFAVYGALSAIRYTKLDIVGVLILGAITATGGGAARDALLGATPVNAISDWRYPAVALVAAFATFWLVRPLAKIEPAIVAFDAIGLGFFAVSGAKKSLEFGVSPIGAILLGVLTAVGGGTIRDVLIGRKPGILYMDLYATCAFIGAGVVVAAAMLNLNPVPAAVVGVVLATVLRIVAWRWRLSAPSIPRRFQHDP